MNKVSVQSLNECFNLSGEDFIAWDDNYDTFQDNIDFYGNLIPTSCASNRGRIWITDGKDSQMIDQSQSIPNGWIRGRKYSFTEEGRRKHLKQSRENNPNSKTYRIVYRDGVEEQIHQLSTWCRNNGYNYSSVKRIVRETKYPKKKQYVCYNSKYYHIKEIHQYKC